MEVAVLNRQRAGRVSSRRLGAFIQRLVEEEPPGEADSLGVCLVSDRRMVDYNRRYRGRPGATDVLSFPGDGRPDPEGRIHLGDIVIAVPTAARQALERGHSLERELETLIVHGYLHLLGHDHEADGGAMLRRQARLLRRLGAGRAAGIAS